LKGKNKNKANGRKYKSVMLRNKRKPSNALLRKKRKPSNGLLWICFGQHSRKRKSRAANSNADGSEAGSWCSS